jgi:hypothetical protein
MRILLLVNHNTAGKFIRDVFIDMGYYVYIPDCITNEDCVLNKKNRDTNYHLYNRRVTNLLDTINFYDYKIPKNIIKKYKKLIEKNFDIVMTTHAINNNIFIGFNIFVYYIVWGTGFENFNMTHHDNLLYTYRDVYDNIMTNVKSKFLICNEHLYTRYIKKKYNEKVVFAQLGFPKYFKNMYQSYINNYAENKKKILFYVSRLCENNLNHIPYYKKAYDLIQNIRKHFFSQNYEIIVVGKNNSINIDGVIFKTFKTENLLHEFIKTCHLHININISSTILQYFSLENMYMGIPTFYEKNSIIDIITHNISNNSTNDIFCYEDILDLYYKINLFFNAPNLFNCKNNIIDIFDYECAVQDWKKIFI